MKSIKAVEKELIELGFKEHFNGDANSHVYYAYAYGMNGDSIYFLGIGGRWKFRYNGRFSYNNNDGVFWPMNMNLIDDGLSLESMILLYGKDLTF